MNLYSVTSNRYRLDGGAMFGNAPKAVWERWIQADERNRLRLATRALLAVTGTHILLVEAGIGAYMDLKQGHDVQRRDQEEHKRDTYGPS